MSEIDRLYRYKTLLSHRRALPREDILAALEISPATFKRDIAKLRDRLGTPIVFDRDLGGYRLDTPQDATELPGFWFTQDEILALMTIQSMIEQLDPGLLGPKLKPLRKRLDDMLTHQGLDPQQLTQRVRAMSAGKRRLPLAAFETIAKATFERKQVQVKHHNRLTGETLERTLSPQQLIHYRDNWYSMQRNGCVRTEKITASIIDKSPDFQAAPGFVAAGRVRERWIASGCGKQVPYFVDFIAGKQTEGGATIYIQIDKTQLSQPQN